MRDEPREPRRSRSRSARPPLAPRPPRGATAPRAARIPRTPGAERPAGAAREARAARRAARRSARRDRDALGGWGRGATQVYVGVDIGGTKILAVEIGGPGVVVGSSRRLMPGREAAVRELEDAITDAVAEVADGRPVAGVGIAAAGLVDAAGERMRFAAHLPWRDVAVRTRLATRWGTHVVLDNDANCAAYAEATHGAAESYGSALLVTVGTGIGGAIVIGGAAWRGASGMAGEFGHTEFVRDGIECQCGLRGCWEQYCSGRALERYVAERGDGQRLAGPAITALAQRGDPLALEAVGEIGARLGQGVAGLVTSFDPQVVVIGGGVSAAGDLLLGPARETMAPLVHGTGHRELPALVPARFGPEAGAVGAALLARTAVESSVWPRRLRR